MARSKYSRGLKIKVAKEAMLPENQGLEHVIAEKYHVMPWTVIKWRDHLQQVGEENPVFDSFLSKKVSQPAILKACETFVIFTITRYIIYFFYLIRC